MNAATAGGTMPGGTAVATGGIGVVAVVQAPPLGGGAAPPTLRLLLSGTQLSACGTACSISTQLNASASCCWSANGGDGWGTGTGGPAAAHLRIQFGVLAG